MSFDALRAEHGAEPFARAVGPASHDHALAEFLKRADVSGYGGHQLLGRLRALNGEVPALLALEVDLDQAAALAGCGKGVKEPELPAREPPLPLLGGKIKRIGGSGL